MNDNDIKKQLIKLRRDKRILWLGIMFFVMVILWILISIFAVTKTSSISPELRELAKSFVPRLESKVFDEIAAKKEFSEAELSSFPIFIFDKKAVDENEKIIDITTSLNSSESSQAEDLQENPASSSSSLDDTASSSSQTTTEPTQQGD